MRAARGVFEVSCNAMLCVRAEAWRRLMEADIQHPHISYDSSHMVGSRGRLTKSAARLFGRRALAVCSIAS